MDTFHECNAEGETVEQRIMGEYFEFKKSKKWLYIV